MKELIELAGNTDFQSEFVNVYIIDNGDSEMTELAYYVWMCELKKWLLDNHKIVVLCTPLDDLIEWCVEVLAPDCMSPFFQAYKGSELQSEAEALKEGLTKALELI